MLLQLALFLFALVAGPGGCSPAEPRVPAGIAVYRDLDYAGTGSAKQRLDVYIPKAPASGALPLVVYFHGGAWEEGDKDHFVGMIFPLVESGEFAGASVNYRLTDEGPHPMQIHDAKAAIRWLRAHAGDYGIDPERISAFGMSAGGHLASLLGTSAGDEALEGKVGRHPDASSRVAAVVSLCGFSDLLAFARQKSRIDPEDPRSPIGKLVGGPASTRVEALRAASPSTYISRDDPPFLHIHGDRDDVVPYEQALEFDRALEAAGVASTVLTAEGAGHVFYSADVRDGMIAFLSQVLLGRDAAVRERTISPR